MFLRTFGGVAIDVESGSGPARLPGPRRLALLAIVASAGARGISREKIAGILWPERDEDHARHALSQTLYLLRRETGAGWITGTSQLRLEPVDSSDVAQFRAAFESGELERAADLYAGPFLDGFYLAGSPDFETWVEETRGRLRFTAIRALETLARRAVDAGNHSESCEWWRRLCEIDPCHAGYAAGRIRALIAAGEPAAALRVAREHESAVRRDLDAEPDPAIAEALTLPPAEPAVLAPKSAHQPARRAEVADPENRAGSPLDPAEPAGRETKVVPSMTAPAGTPREPTTVRPSRSRRLAISAALALLVTSSAFALVWGRIRAPRNPELFLAIGTIQPRDATSPGTVLRDMLATNLARVAGLQVVANSRLVELLARSDGGTADMTVDAARRAGATQIVEGELAETPEGMVLTLRRVSLADGLVLQGYTVRAADLYALTDSATAAIAIDFGMDPPPDPVATVRTGSAVAYALYEQGLRAYFHGDLPAASRLMSAALERDSAFAMAAAYLWRSRWDDNRYELAAPLVPTVRRLASRAAPRERLWIEGMLAYAGAPQSDFLDIARELALRFPEDPDGQVLLGRSLFAGGDWAGSVAAYDRAIAIDSASGATSGTFCRVCQATVEMSTTYAWWDSLPAAERTIRRLIAFRPGAESGWTGLVESLLRQGRRADAEAAIAQATRLSPRPVDFAFLLDRDLIRSGRLEELEARLVPALRTATPEARGEMPWMLGFALRNQGRMREARDLAALGVVPGSPLRLQGHFDAVTLAVAELEAGHAQEAARRFLDQADLDRARNEQAGFAARNLSWHLTLAGTALAAAGDTATVRALADSVERIGQRSSFGRDFRLHYFLRGLLLQRENRHAEAVDAFRRSLFSLTDGYTRINLEMARCLQALGRYPEAIAVLQPTLRGGVDGGNTYVTHTELHEALALAFEAAGQPDSATAHFAAVERAWRHADPEFAERYRYARSRASPTY